MESLDRIMNIPVVESGWNYAGNIYGRLKRSNDVLHWAFGRAESSFDLVLNKGRPVIVLFRGPLSTLDRILCQSLDVVEEKVPVINLPPDMILCNTRKYVDDVGDRLIRPILKRADSVKQIGNNVLESKYTAFAADTLDGALTVADKYVDMYLPPDTVEPEKEARNAHEVRVGPGQKAIKTIHHMDQFSRKLQRRLTRRTLAEARALREHSSEVIHVLVYALDLIANDPKMAYYKSQQLWYSLSEDEPENQARPENLEELVVMLTRESVRRLVHFVNFANALAKRLPDDTKTLVGRCFSIAEGTLKVTHVDDVNRTMLEVARSQAHRLALLLHKLNLYTTELLEQVAKSLEQQERNIKSSAPSGATRSAGVQIRVPRKYTNIMGNGMDGANA